VTRWWKTGSPWAPLYHCATRGAWYRIDQGPPPPLPQPAAWQRLARAAVSRHPLTPDPIKISSAFANHPPTRTKPGSARGPPTHPRTLAMTQGNRPVALCHRVVLLYTCIIGMNDISLYIYRNDSQGSIISQGCPCNGTASCTTPLAFSKNQVFENQRNCQSKVAELQHEFMKAR
jgi:hypothetical protein